MHDEGLEEGLEGDGEQGIEGEHESAEKPDEAVACFAVLFDEAIPDPGEAIVAVNDL